ncbi:MAG: DUF1571 domain-containing protein [Rubripirellula sp.]
MITRFHALAGLIVLMCLPLVPTQAEGLASIIDKKDSHPLGSALDYAQTHRKYIHEHIRNYTCQLVKRERIVGRMQPYQFVDVKVRCETLADQEPFKPMAVLMKFMGPASVKGRTVLFVEGQNEGRALVRKGGRGMFKDVELEIDPDGDAARRESKYPITDIGLDSIMDHLIELVQLDLHIDPSGENTKVAYFRNAKVKDRSCTHIEVVHPEKVSGLQFYKAELYVDDELHVPIRLVVHDWPSTEGSEPELIEEYNYVNLKLNTEIDDALFDRDTYFNHK